MPRPSGGPAKHVAESSVVFALWLVQTFTRTAHPAIGQCPFFTFIISVRPSVSVSVCYSCPFHCMSYLPVSTDAVFVTPSLNLQVIIMVFFRLVETIMHDPTECCPKTSPPTLETRALLPFCRRLKASVPCVSCCLLRRLCEEDCVLPGVLTEGQDGKYQ